MAHYHDPSAGTQNQGNMLGGRACVRQSKLFRQYESGNSVKDLLGTGHLQWDTTQKQGAYSGQPVYDYHHDPHAPPMRHNDHQRHEAVQSLPAPPASNVNYHSPAFNDHAAGSTSPGQGGRNPRTVSFELGGGHPNGVRSSAEDARYPGSLPLQQATNTQRAGDSSASTNVHLRDIRQRQAAREQVRKADIEAERRDDARVIREAAMLRHEAEGEIAQQRSREAAVAEREASYLRFMAQHQPRHQRGRQPEPSKHVQRERHGAHHATEGADTSWAGARAKQTPDQMSDLLGHHTYGSQQHRQQGQSESSDNPYRQALPRNAGRQQQDSHGAGQVNSEGIRFGESSPYKSFDQHGGGRGRGAPPPPPISPSGNQNIAAHHTHHGLDPLAKLQDYNTRMRNQHNRIDQGNFLPENREFPSRSDSMRSVILARVTPGGSIPQSSRLYDERSSNSFANGHSQNTGNYLTDRRTTRVLAPPGGASSFSLG